MLPFTSAEFFAVFATYNVAIWPAQIVAYLAGAAAVAAVFYRRQQSDRIIAICLVAMWAWTGAAYHLLFFAPINNAAYGFGALFLLQAVGFAYAAFRHRLSFGFQADAAAWTGVAFVVYAAVIYPLVGLSAGHRYPELPMFGLTPCPVTIFTFGLLLLTLRPPPLLLLPIPVIWSLIGGSAAILLDVPQDWPLLASVFIAAPLLLGRRWRKVAV